MNPLSLANGILKLYADQQVAIAKLLSGELPEGDCEFCGTDCSGYHSEGPDLEAKEIMREGGHHAQDCGDGHLRQGA